ncbi:hypothetical protein OKW23_001329 [Bacilli bacterium PM5-9]|nr:hypothetical protein [Bacilli bacterium PM5-9]
MKKRLFLIGFLVLFLNINIQAKNFTAKYTPENPDSYKSTVVGEAKATKDNVEVDRYYEYVGEYDVTYRSYFKKVGDYWFNYQTQSSQVLEKYPYVSTVHFFYNVTKCQAGEPIAYNCVATASNSSKPRIYMEDDIDEYNVETGKYSERTVTTYGNNDFDDYISKKIYYSNKKLAEYYTYTINSKGITVLETIREYFYNGVLKSISVEKSKSNGSYNGGTYKQYNSLGKLLYYDIYSSYDETTYEEIRKYYSNGKIKNKEIIKRTPKGVIKSDSYIKYYKNGKKKTSKNITSDKYGDPNKITYYVYNKIGQLKSNKNGKAYKYTTKVVDWKAKTTLRRQYNKKGKLGKAIKVKSPKVARNFKY